MSRRGRDLDDVDQIIEQVRALARFPSENPNPVMRLTGAGQVLYANEAAKGIGGLLVGRAKDQLAKRLANVAAKAAKSHRRQNVEFEADGRAYAFVLAPVVGEVLRLRHDPAGQPLLFHGGQYRGVAEKP